MTPHWLRIYVKHYQIYTENYFNFAIFYPLDYMPTLIVPNKQVVKCGLTVSFFCTSETEPEWKFLPKTKLGYGTMTSVFPPNIITNKVNGSSRIYKLSINKATKNNWGEYGCYGLYGNRKFYAMGKLKVFGE